MAAPVPPRIPPLPLDGIDSSVQEIVQRSADALGTDNQLFAVMARHPLLLRKWLPFGNAVLQRGRLPRRLTELAVLRTAFNVQCAYEWAQHVEIAQRVGLSGSDIVAVSRPHDAHDWSHQDQAVLDAVDQLHRDHRIGDATFARLADKLDADQILELCLLVGHYAMLAMVIETAGVRPAAALPRLPERADVISTEHSVKESK
jgi:4-carboxymuconolactone decarboxylase